MILKDTYDKFFIAELGTKISELSVSFNSRSFSSSIINADWEERALKDRMRFITQNIHSHLNHPYPKQIELLSQIVANYSGLKGMIFPDFIQVYGLNDLAVSLKAIALFTKYSTAEFAIRPFIEKYPLQSMQKMEEWSLHKNHHLRRLASEGCRPKLPWAPFLSAFIADPSPTLTILENLKNDDSIYVRKSVANHLNDISKDHPKLVLDICENWFGKAKGTNWIVKHALRTLLKKGDKTALAIFGLANSEQIEIKHLMLSEKSISIGNFIHFEFDVRNTSKQERNIRLEYKIGFMKANGSRADKVFQISAFSLKANSVKHIKRKQWFKELSTRKHYPGPHKITPIVNGDKKGSIDFILNR